MVSRVTKSTPSAHRHSLLDELTFNRDFDGSGSTAAFGKAEKWQFHPSYSGFATDKTRMPQSRKLPVNMMDTFLSDRATTPQIVEPSMYATNRMVKTNPNLRGFVTDKVTNVGFTPTTHERPPTRTSCSKLVRDHDHELLVNITTPAPYRFVPNAPLFRPLGSVPPATHAPGRPYTTHEPGRHRFFVSDVRHKIT